MHHANLPAAPDLDAALHHLHHVEAFGGAAAVAVHHGTAAAAQEAAAEVAAREAEAQRVEQERKEEEERFDDERKEAERMQKVKEELRKRAEAKAIKDAFHTEVKLSAAAKKRVENLHSERNRKESEEKMKLQNSKKKKCTKAMENATWCGFLARNEKMLAKREKNRKLIEKIALANVKWHCSFCPQSDDNSRKITQDTLDKPRFKTYHNLLYHRGLLALCANLERQHERLIECVEAEMDECTFQPQPPSIEALRSAVWVYAEEHAGRKAYRLTPDFDGPRPKGVGSKASVSRRAQADVYECALRMVLRININITKTSFW